MQTYLSIVCPQFHYIPESLYRSVKCPFWFVSLDSGGMRLVGWLRNIGPHLRACNCAFAVLYLPFPSSFFLFPLQAHDTNTQMVNKMKSPLTATPTIKGTLNPVGWIHCIPVQPDLHPSKQVPFWEQTPSTQFVLQFLSQNSPNRPWMHRKHSPFSRTHSCSKHSFLHCLLHSSPNNPFLH